jgi:hypothetical protein
MLHCAVEKQCQSYYNENKKKRAKHQGRLSLIQEKRLGHLSTSKTGTPFNIKD